MKISKIFNIYCIVDYSHTHTVRRSFLKKILTLLMLPLPDNEVKRWVENLRCAGRKATWGKIWIYLQLRCEKNDLLLLDDNFASSLRFSSAMQQHHEGISEVNCRHRVKNNTAWKIYSICQFTLPPHSTPTQIEDDAKLKIVQMLYRSAHSMWWQIFWYEILLVYLLQQWA